MQVLGEGSSAAAFGDVQTCINKVKLNIETSQRCSAELKEFINGIGSRFKNLVSTEDKVVIEVEWSR